MKLVFKHKTLFCLLIFAMIGKAAASETTPASPKSVNGAGGVGSGVGSGVGTSGTTSISPEKLREELTALASRDADSKVVTTAVEPSSRTCTSVTYSFPGEKKLNPGESIYLAVPADLRNSSVNAALLGHRQDPNDGNNKELWEQEQKNPEKRPWDNQPGTTSMQFHLRKSDKPGKAWRYYQAPWNGSGDKGAKFAEVGTSLERENLEGIRSHGHVGVNSGETSKAPLLLDAVRLVSNGKDPVHVGYATVKFDPKSVHTEEKIFTPGTSFEDLKEATSAHYGGGEQFGGSYPKALGLNGGNVSVESLPSGWEVIGSALQIAAKEGKHITAVEVLVGDMHADGKKNKDGSTGSSGWASLSIDYVKKSGERETFMSAENVGKNDTLSGFPRDCTYKATKGDKIVIKATGDVAHVMGVRVHYDE